MATTKYSDLLDDVLPSLGADPSDPVTEYAIKRAVIDFCAGSWVWKIFPDNITTTANEAAYDLEPPAGADIATIVSIELDGVPLTNKSPEWLNQNLPGWRTTQATPKHYTQVDTEQVILAPLPPSSTSVLTLTLALQPSQASTGFPSWIASQFMYAIADGALSRLMLMPNKPWTDLPNGQDRRSQFNAAIANARAGAAGALGRAPVRVTPQH